MFEYICENITDKVEKVRFSFCDIMFFDIGKAWRHASAKSEHYTLFAVESGSLRLLTTLGKIIIEENCALVLPPDTKIRSGTSDDPSIRFFEASFDVSAPFFEVFSKQLLQEPQEFFGGLSRLYKMRFENSCADVVSDTLLYSLLAMLSSSSASASDKNGELTLTREILNIIDRNIGRELDIDAVANTLGLARSHISRVFTKVTGKTIKAYINEKRVAYACDLLSNSSFSIGEIACLTGFEESNLFTKFFIYHTGLTPSDYRRKVYNISPISKNGKGYGEYS